VWFKSCKRYCECRASHCPICPNSTWWNFKRFSNPMLPLIVGCYAGLFPLFHNHIGIRQQRIAQIQHHNPNVVYATACPLLFGICSRLIYQAVGADLKPALFHLGALLGLERAPNPLDASRPTKLIPEEANISVGNPHTCDIPPPRRGPIPPDRDIDE